MKIKYFEETKLKKNNPFLKMRDEDRNRLREVILQTVFWVAELHANQDLECREIYAEMIREYERKTKDAPFGKNGRGIPNTGLAALTGAAEKLGRGDLSRTQLDNIENILRYAATRNKDIPHIEFENIEEKQSKRAEGFNNLFEVQT